MSKLETRIHLKTGRIMVMPGLVEQSIDDAIVGISRAKSSNGVINMYDMDGTEPVPAGDIKSIEIVFKD